MTHHILPAVRAEMNTLMGMYCLVLATHCSVYAAQVKAGPRDGDQWGARLKEVPLLLLGYAHFKTHLCCLWRGGYHNSSRRVLIKTQLSISDLFRAGADYAHTVHQIQQKVAPP